MECDYLHSIALQNNRISYCHCVLRSNSKRHNKTFIAKHIVMVISNFDSSNLFLIVQLFYITKTDNAINLVTQYNL
jgi:hypothetical protein